MRCAADHWLSLLLLASWRLLQPMALKVGHCSKLTISVSLPLTHNQPAHHLPLLFTPPFQPLPGPKGRCQTHLRPRLSSSCAAGLATAGPNLSSFFCRSGNTYIWKHSLNSSRTLAHRGTSVDCWGGQAGAARSV